MKNSLIICFVLCLLLLTACAHQPISTPGLEDNQSTILPGEEMPAEAENDEYVLLVGNSKQDPQKSQYAMLDKNISSIEEGEEYLADLLEQYFKVSKSNSIKSISSDGRFIVSTWRPNDSDRTIVAYEGLNLIFSNTVKEEDTYFLSAMDYALPSGDYDTKLTAILGSGYQYSYPVANVMIDLESSKGFLPLQVNDECTMYLTDEFDYDLGIATYFIYSYPEHKLIKSFERLDGEELLSSDANTVNQLLDENRIIYTVWDNNTTYLLDLSNNTETALGTALLTPCFSPDGKYFAYASQDSFLPGFYLYDLGNDETFYYEVGENEYPRIIGWAKKDNMINTNN